MFKEKQKTGFSNGDRNSKKKSHVDVGLHNGPERKPF